MDEDTNVDDTQTTGVPAAEQTVDRPLTKREQQMAAIKVRRETDDDDGGQQPSQDQQQQQTDPALDEQIDAQLNDEPMLIEDPSRARVRIKVDGEETEVSVAEAIRNCAEAGHDPIAIYGAGTHTHKCAHALAEPAAAIACIIDDNPDRHGSTLWGYPIVSLAEAIRRRVRAIILSSDAFEHQLWDKCADARAAGIEVVRIYTNDMAESVA